MNKLRDSNWAEVYGEWRKSEDSESWKEFYEKKGFRSWEDWRWSRIKMFGLESRKWELFAPENAVEEVRSMFCDLATRWRDFCPVVEKSDFLSLSKRDELKMHPKILGLRENFPEDSWLMGFKNNDRGIILDGHHRACALAGMEKDKALSVTFAFSEIGEKEFDKYHNLGIALIAERRAYDVVNLIRTRVKKVF
jgi:hypothetical protein